MAGLTIIVAMTPSGLIGAGGKLPWHLPRDLKRFRKRTMGQPIVMGRRTFESLGRPLPGRLNIVLSRRPDYHAEGAIIAPGLTEAIAIAEASNPREIFVIGGGEVFRESLPLATRIDLTIVQGEFEGDTLFPVELLEESHWESRHEEHWDADDANPHPLQFRVLERRAFPAAPTDG